MRSLIVAHSMRSLFSVSRPRICLGTFFYSFYDALNWPAMKRSLIAGQCLVNAFILKPPALALVSQLEHVGSSIQTGRLLLNLD